MDIDERIENEVALNYEGVTDEAGEPAWGVKSFAYFDVENAPWKFLLSRTENKFLVRREYKRAYEYLKRLWARWPGRGSAICGNPGIGD